MSDDVQRGSAAYEVNWTSTGEEKLFAALQQYIQLSGEATKTAEAFARAASAPVTPSGLQPGNAAANGGSAFAGKGLSPEVEARLRDATSNAARAAAEAADARAVAARAMADAARLRAEAASARSQEAQGRVTAAASPEERASAQHRADLFAAQEQASQARAQAADASARGAEERARAAHIRSQNPGAARAESATAGGLADMLGWLPFLPGGANTYMMQMGLRAAFPGIGGGLLLGATGLMLGGAAGVGIADTMASTAALQHLVGAMSPAGAPPSAAAATTEQIRLLQAAWGAGKVTDQDVQGMLASATRYNVATAPGALNTSLSLGLAQAQYSKTSDQAGAQLVDLLTARSGGNADRAAQQLLALDAAIEKLGRSTSAQQVTTDILGMADQLQNGTNVAQLAGLSAVGQPFGLTGSQTAGGWLTATGAKGMEEAALLGISGDQLEQMQQQNPLGVISLASKKAQQLKAQGVNDLGIEAILGDFYPQNTNAHNYTKALTSGNIQAALQAAQAAAAAANAQPTDAATFVEKQRQAAQAELTPQQKGSGYLTTEGRGIASWLGAMGTDLGKGQFGSALADLFLLPGSNGANAFLGAIGVTGGTGSMPAGGMGGAGGRSLGTVTVELGPQASKLLQLQSTGKTSATPTPGPTGGTSVNIDIVPAGTPGETVGPPRRRGMQ